MTFTTTILALATVITLQSPANLANQTASIPAESTTVANLSTTTAAEILATSTDASGEIRLADLNEKPQPEIASSTESVEDQVKTYFSDIPVLIDVAQCESNFTQTNPDGTIFRGVINPDDVGVMQINQYYNGESAERLGYNIMTLEGNLAFARHLYNVYGTEPWSASEKCWAPKAGLENFVAVKE